MTTFNLKQFIITADSIWLQVDLMDMATQGSEEYLVRMHDISANVMVQKLMWTFHEQVSHKLRTPLSKLTGFLGLLREDEGELSKEDRDSILLSADSGAQQLQQEILSVFQYMDSLNQPVSSFTYCSADQIPTIIVESAADLSIDSVNISDNALDGAKDIYIPTNYRTTELVLWEILQNAKKFHPKNEPAIEVDLSSNSTEVCIQISDNGLTLSPEQLVKMWVPYYQVEKGFSGQVPGMGLGLSMVASLIWNIGGTCRSYNREYGSGIIVELTLPTAVKD